MITLNGSPREAAGLSLEDLLKAEGFNKSQIAVGLNGHVAPKDEYHLLKIKDGDEVEVFQFMGGG
jgi:thiamine biosynthesis protein ThiS